MLARSAIIPPVEVILEGMLRNKSNNNVTVDTDNTGVTPTRLEVTSPNPPVNWIPRMSAESAEV
jgi:hypothetical protein